MRIRRTFIGATPSHSARGCAARARIFCKRRCDYVEVGDVCARGSMRVVCLEVRVGSDGCDRMHVCATCVCVHLRETVWSCIACGCVYIVSVNRCVCVRSGPRGTDEGARWLCVTRCLLKGIETGEQSPAPPITRRRRRPCPGDRSRCTCAQQGQREPLARAQKKIAWRRTQPYAGVSAVAKSIAVAGAPYGATKRCPG